VRWFLYNGGNGSAHTALCLWYYWLGPQRV